jgi:Flp pilus assembly protein TadB
MSKERARRREEREREAALKQAARAAEAERRERRAARTKAWRAAGRRVGLVGPSRPDGIIARRRRRQHTIVLGLLLLLVAVGFAVRPDWPARLAFLVVAVFAYPVLRVLLFKRV